MTHRPPRDVPRLLRMAVLAALLLGSSAPAAFARGEPPKVKAVHAELRSKLHGVA